MPSLDRQALSWLRAHHATISTDALDDAGVSLDQLKYLVEVGTLQRIIDGAYAFAGVESDELARCAALCTSRPHLVVAGPTAARIWALRRAPRDGLIHVIAPPRSHPCQEPWVRAYRTSMISADEIVDRIDGVRLTNPSRTVVDLTRYTSEDAVSSMVEDVLHRGLCTPTSLHRVAEALATPGRPWARRFVRLLARRHPGAAAESDAERRVLEALVSRGVLGVERQVPVELPGYGPARFDMAIPHLKLAIEVDLHPEHASPVGIANDHWRDDCAASVGWATRRVGQVELTQQFDATIDRLLAFLQRRRDER